MEWWVSIVDYIIPPIYNFDILQYELNAPLFKAIAFVYKSLIKRGELRRPGRTQL